MNLKETNEHGCVVFSGHIQLCGSRHGAGREGFTQWVFCYSNMMRIERGKTVENLCQGVMIL